VFANLLTNAARYTDPGGRIFLSAAATDGGRARVAVRDTGRGIAPEMIERIFEPFTQADRRKDALAGGLGLGLAIVRALVALHGGSVTAASDGVGHGSEFVVDLPLSLGERRIEVSAEAVRRLPSAMRRILVVDDNEDAADLLRVALEARRHEVQVAGTGSAALVSVGASAPDVALLDIGLPDMNGYELASKLRERFGDEVTLVALTGYGEESARAASRQAGFDVHLVKPVRLDQLFAMIED
jgi:CheY-like chemotaxis protein